MRRLLLVMVMAVAVFSLYASHIISDGSLPDDVLSAVSEAIGRETYGRSDLVFHADSYTETDLENGGTAASFMLSYSDKAILTEGYGKDREELLSSFSYSIHGILFYEESLFSDAPLSLGYIVDRNYSFLSDVSLRRGTKLRVGTVRAVFEVGENYDGAVSLDPVYLRSPMPGMTLEKAGEWKLSGSLSTSFRFSSPEIFAQISLGRTDLIYPFVPTVSFAYCYSAGRSDVYAGVGLEAYLNLYRVFPSVSFTLVEEGRIGGSVSILAGGGAEGFDWRSVFSIFYEHRALPSLYWRVGYQNLQGTHMLVIGMGGDF